MIGVIAGDIMGSVYEHQPTKTTDFPLFQASSRLPSGRSAGSTPTRATVAHSSNGWALTMPGLTTAGATAR